MCKKCGARKRSWPRMINALGVFRAVATRFDERAHVFHGTVTVASIRLRLRTRPAGQPSRAC